MTAPTQMVTLEDAEAAVRAVVSAVAHAQDGDERAEASVTGADMIRRLRLHATEGGS